MLANGAEWKNVPGSQTVYDASSMQRQAGKVRVWIREFAGNGAAQDEVVELREYNCGERAINVLEVYRRFPSGQMQPIEERANPVEIQVPPGSIHEHDLDNLFCPKKPAKKNGKR